MINMSLKKQSSVKKLSIRIPNELYEKMQNRVKNGQNNTLTDVFLDALRKYLG